MPRDTGSSGCGGKRVAPARLPVPGGDGFVWIAAEAETVRALRRHMLEVRGHRPGWVKASGYWVRGQDGAHENFRAET